MGNDCGGESSSSSSLSWHVLPFLVSFAAVAFGAVVGLASWWLAFRAAVVLFQLVRTFWLVVAGTGVVFAVWWLAFSAAVVGVPCEYLVSVSSATKKKKCFLN